MMVSIIFSFTQRASLFLYVAREVNQSTGNCSSISVVHGGQKHIPQSSTCLTGCGVLKKCKSNLLSHSHTYANNNGSALCCAHAAKCFNQRDLQGCRECRFCRSKNLPCCLNPLLSSTLGLIKGKLAA